mmetsp:Transcript_19237/g.46453  ORF Transcript_19237/g.46453 Transcript_19237/m.46453 type:complete len:716 (-) Transcript_19237:104-2251(-)
MTRFSLSGRMNRRRLGGRSGGAVADPPAAMSSCSRRGSSQFKHRFLKPGPSPTNHTTGAVLPGENLEVSKSERAADFVEESEEFGTPYNPIDPHSADEAEAEAEKAAAAVHLADPYCDSNHHRNSFIDLINEDGADMIPKGLSVDSADTQTLIERQKREEQHGLSHDDIGPLDPAGSTEPISLSQDDGNDENAFNVDNTMEKVTGEATKIHGGGDYERTTDHLREIDTFSSAGEDTHQHFLGTVNSTEERQTSVHLREPIDSGDFYDDDGEGGEGGFQQSSYLGNYHEGAEGGDDDDDQAFTFGSGEEEDDFAAPSEMHMMNPNDSHYDPHHDNFHHDHDGFHQNHDEATYGDDTYDCSKTLNTNDETLHTNLEGVNFIPMMNGGGMMDPNTHNQQLLLAYDDDGGGNAYNRESLEHIGSYLYEDDGHVHYEDGDGVLHEVSSGEGSGFETTYSEEGTFVTGADDDGNTFQETLTTEFDQSLHSGNHRIVDKMMDSYLSDQSSVNSWEEGSFAGGASRTVSRVDSMDDDDDYDSGDDERKRAPSRRSSVAEDRTLMGLFRKFRDMNMPDDSDDDDDDDSLDDDDDEDYDSDYDDEYEDNEYEGEVPGLTESTNTNSNSERTRESLGSSSRSGRKNRRSSGVKGKHRGQKTPEVGDMLNKLGSMSMDFLHDTIEKQKPSKSSKKSRRRSKHDHADRTSQLLDSFQTIFSCGAPTRR